MKMNKKINPLDLAIIIAVICLLLQSVHIMQGSISVNAQKPFFDGTGGPSAPAPPGQFHSEPPPHGAPDTTSPGDGGGGIPGQRPGGRVTIYPAIPKEGLSERTRQLLEARFVLHRWVLSDMLWGVVQLEKSSDYQLTREQAKKLYPVLENLATSVQVVEESNRLMKGLLREDQVKYFEEKIYDADYMGEFMSTYSPGEAMPTFGISDTILDKCRQALEQRAGRH